MFFSFFYFFLLKISFFSSCSSWSISPIYENCLLTSSVLQKHVRLCAWYSNAQLTAHRVLISYLCPYFCICSSAKLYGNFMLSREHDYMHLDQSSISMLLIISQAPCSTPSPYTRFWSVKALALKLPSETPEIQDDYVTSGSYYREVDGDFDCNLQIGSKWTKCQALDNDS